MPPARPHSRVLVFAKAPIPGAVKTRLIPLLGAEGAARLQARLIEHTLAIVRHADPDSIELHGEPADDPFLRDCAGRYRATLIQQCRGDLGARMQHAFEAAFTRDPQTPAIGIGTDCPALALLHLQRAAQMLTAGHDAVFAPAEDGGYVLIGLCRSAPRLFEDVAWSTAHVMEQTRERLRELRWRWLELETLWDVDQPADYQRLDRSGLL